MTSADWRPGIAQRLAALSSPLRIVVIAGVCAVLAVILFWLFNELFYYMVAKSYVDDLAVAYDLNKNLASAFVWASFAVLVGLAGYSLSFNKRKRLVGSIGVLVLLIGHSLLIWYAVRGDSFSADGKSAKCYVMMRDNFKIRNRVGIDPETGRECRPMTPQMAEKLEEYRKGKRATPIVGGEPAFFDALSGEPVIWYSRAKSGAIEIFDLMGFHPRTGEELLPVTPQVADAWQTQMATVIRRAPGRVDPEKYNPFDPVTGAPRMWVWQEGSQYEFYDGPGFQPRTGESLKIVSRDVLAAWRRETEAAAAKKKADDELRAKEQRERTERERQEIAEKERIARQAEAEAQRQQQEALRQQQQAAAEAQRQQQDALRQQQQAAAEVQRQQQEALRQQQQAAAEAQQIMLRAASDCDRLATNPTDQRKAAEGVPFDMLKPQADQALEACSKAAQQFPTELRYKYQLGRATYFKDRNKAFEIFSSLVAAGYPAAYDNLGSMYLFADRKDVGRAIGLFQRGSAVNDADSKVSLADLIDKRIAPSLNPDADKWMLLKQAADLGHVGAQRAVARQLAQEEEQRRNGELAGQILGGILGAAMRR